MSSSAYGQFAEQEFEPESEAADTGPSAAAYVPPPVAGGQHHASGGGFEPQIDYSTNVQYQVDQPPASQPQYQGGQFRSAIDANQRQQQQYAPPPPAAVYQGPPVPTAQTQVLPAVQAAAPGTYMTSAAPSIDAGRHRSAAAMASVKSQKTAKLRPERGWRRWVLLLTRYNMGLSPDEEYERELFAQVRKIVTPPPGTVRGFEVAIVALKGGVGKTILSVLLGSIIAKIRGQAVLAVDADPDRGDLVERTRDNAETKNTVAQLVSAADELTGYNAVRKMTNQNEHNLEVLAAADYVDAAREFNSADWNTATEVVSPFYPIVIADCGVGLHTSAVRAVLDSVWAIVVVTDVSGPGARAAGDVFDWLRNHGYADLADRSVAVINYRERRKSKAMATEIRDKLIEIMGGKDPGARIFELPFDAHIEQGGAIDMRLVSSTVRRRITEIAAALSEHFDQPRRIGAPGQQVR